MNSQAVHVTFKRKIPHLVTSYDLVVCNAQYTITLNLTISPISHLVVLLNF